MHSLTSLLRIFVVLSVLTMPLQAQQSNEIRSYVFGNSLINHLSESDETTVPHWLYHLAKAANNDYAVEGQWGLLRNFAIDLPPIANWSFHDIPGIWNPDRKSFGKAGFNTILINPANYIQYQAPNVPYDGDNEGGATPVSATLETFDWLADQQLGMHYYIYEGWADMAGLIGHFPPSQAGLKQYHSFVLGESHEWYKTYVGALQEARPDQNIKLIPVAPILSKLLTNPALSGIPATELYADDAPHGTATLYFLASLITYQYLYSENAPLNFDIPETVHPLVRDNYPMIVRFIASYNTASVGNSPANPSLAMGLDGIADWSAQQPFVDIMKSARPWTGHLAGQWGGWDADDLEIRGYLDVDGWPKSIPNEVTHVEAFILTNQPKEAVSLRGRYRLKYDGEGSINLSGRAYNIKYSSGEIRFDFTPGEDTVGIIIKETDPKGTGNYIRNISVVKVDDIPLFQVGVVFNPHWIRRIKDLRSVRFMDWMFTNGSMQSEWNRRPKIADYTYVRRGVPVEMMVKLANEIGVDPWFNMPHMATDTYSRNFASYVYTNLDPRLKTYVEYSNEVWNFTFPQTAWALHQAEERWGSKGKQDGWMQFAGMRAAIMAKIWGEVYGASANDRLVRVIAAHTDWPGLEEGLLQAPLWQAENGNAPPVSSFDAYAVTGYFGLDLGTDEKAPTVLEWIKQSLNTAVEAAGTLGLSGQEYEAYIAAHKYDLAVSLVAQNILDDSLNHLLTDALPYQSKVAAENGLDLIMYEGGTHVVGIGEWAGNPDLSAFFNHFNYTPEVAEVYKVLLNKWREIGGTQFNAFVDVARTSRWGSWGSLRHLDDQNPRWDVLKQFNAETPAWWSNRSADTFTQGVFQIGTEAVETLKGTSEEDTLLADDGDDVLVSSGGGDYLHGGGGFDRAVLSGLMTDYSFQKQDAVLLAIGPTGTTRLFSIEALQFEADPDVVHMVSDL